LRIKSLTANPETQGHRQSKKTLARRKALLFVDAKSGVEWRGGVEQGMS